MQDAATPIFQPRRLYAAAKEAGLTQQDIAMRLGMSMRAVQKWFLGESTPGGDKLIALARLLHIEPAALFEPVPNSNGREAA
jgi:transcriptional regulator with XRE-family HTH domain